MKLKLRMDLAPWVHLVPRVPREFRSSLALSAKRSASPVTGAQRPLEQLRSLKCAHVIGCTRWLCVAPTLPDFRVAMTVQTPKDHDVCPRRCRTHSMGRGEGEL